MRIRAALFLLASTLAAAAGCSSSGSSGGTPRGGEGAACVDGTNCQQGLVCFVATDDPTAGVCTAAPAACGGTLDCSCMSDLDAQCASGANCEGSSAGYSVACAQSGTYRQDGQTCSSLISCDAGLFCYVAGAGHAGKCSPLPAACGTSPTCDCLQGAHPCNNYECWVGGNLATLVCR